MKKLNNFWFGVILILSILVVMWCFDYADNFRGYNSTGGEVFTIALVIWIVERKISQLEQIIHNLKQQNNELKKSILNDTL